jgi:ubiquinone/menaquinone biosynthesis C-methylase UbiE
LLYNSAVESMSFDAIASVYDDTRVFDETCFNAALDYLVSRFPPLKYPALFEPGIGTGRIAIPLAERGYKVTGADISTEMLKILADKLARRPGLPVKFINQDITSLPFPDASYDICVAVSIFHLIPAWQKAVDEVFRVLKPTAPLILMFTGVGIEDPSIEKRYHQLCAEYGYTIKNIGVSAKTELPVYLTGLGRRIEKVGGLWQWRQRVRVDRFVANIRSRKYSYASLAPDDIHFKVMETLEAELIKQYGSLAIETEMPTEITMMLVLPA